jgi:hypothetical protein
LLYRIATSGSHGTIGLSGLQIKLIPLNQEAPRTDLNHDGKLESWEANRILSIQTADGNEIMDDHRYQVATFDFLLSGGDDLAWFMQQIPSRMISRKVGGYCRELVADYLKSAKLINTPEHPLVDPAHPRIRFESVLNEKK